jgi:hypothetical protein
MVDVPHGYKVHDLPIESCPSWNAKATLEWFEAIAARVNLWGYNGVGVLFMIGWDCELQMEKRKHMRRTLFNREFTWWTMINSIPLHPLGT